MSLGSSAKVYIAPNDETGSQLQPGGQSYKDPGFEAKAMKLGERKCTDCLFLVLFIVFWVGMFYVAAVGFMNGDPAKLINPSDYLGGTCGSLKDTCFPKDDAGSCSSKPFGTFPRLAEDIYNEMKKGGASTFDPLELKVYTVCAEACPKKGDWICNYDAQSTFNTIGKAAAEACYDKYQAMGGLLTGYSSTFKDTHGANCATVIQGCWKQHIDSTDFLFRCLPQEVKNATCTYATVPPAGSKNAPKRKDGSPLLASDKQCGECVDPKYKADDGNAGTPLVPMPPWNPACKSKKVYSISVEELEGGETRNPVLEQLGTWSAVITSIAGDIKVSIGIIIGCGIGLAIVGGWLWILILRYCAGVFVWTVVLGFQGFLILAALQLLIYGKVIDFTSAVADTKDAAVVGDVVGSIAKVDLFSAETEGREEEFATYGYIMSVVAGFFFLSFLFMFKRIRIGVAILKEGGKAIAAIPALLFWPIVPIVLSVILFAYAVTVGAFVMSAGEIQVGELVAPAAAATGINELDLSLDAATIEKYGRGRQLAELENAGAHVQEFANLSTRDLLGVYHFFGFLWTNAFFTGIGIMAVAGAVCQWYWTPKRKEAAKAGRFRNALKESVGRTFRYHLGSVAFGALVIAVVQFLRAALAYLDKNTKTLQKKNAVIRLLFKVVQCCMPVKILQRTFVD